MVGEALAGISALKAAFDVAKGIKDIDDAVRRNAAVIELQEKILTAQQAQSALIEQVGELEKEVARLKAWDAEKQRYELKTIARGTVAYMLKPAERGSEPPHWLCATCHGKSKKAFLQNTGMHLQRSSIYMCGECQAKLATDGDPKWIE
jgi:Zn finger protein HypA/HybF involved in hydrogenase expression